ncbi:MAG: hypothetical protein QNK33_04715 [Bacteroidales bacterium]|nr:hypothetical protein [Bacteroidales bacterium]
MESTDKRYKVLKEDLNNADPNKLKAIINSLRNETVIPGIILLLKDIMEDCDNDQVLTELTSFLNDLKDQSLATEVIEAIETTKSDLVQQKLIASCWQSGLDYSGHLDHFIDYSIKLSYLATLECYSVIEEWANEADENSKTIWRKSLQLSLNDQSKEKKNLIKAIISLL